MQLERGVQVGKYRLIGQHWDGGLGDVWVAKRVDSEDDTLYALRFLRSLDRERIGEVRAWAGAAVDLEEAIFARVYSVAQDGQYLAVVSDLIRGESLRQVNRVVRGWPKVLALCTILEVARALLEWQKATGEAAHGDISSDRLLLDYEASRLVTTEPGLYPILRPGSTNSGSDVYGLAVVLWEMLTGRIAPEQESGTRIGPKFPTLKACGVSSVKILDSLLRSALAQDPLARYRSLETFIEDLERCVGPRHTSIDVQAELKTLIRQRLQHRAHGVQTLLLRWGRTAKHIRRNPAPLTASVRAPRPAVTSAARPPPEARPLAEPGLVDIPILAPVEARGGDTDDLIPVTDDLPPPKPNVVRALRQLTLLGVLAAVALGAHAYASTTHGFESLAVWRLLAAQLLGG